MDTKALHQWAELLLDTGKRNHLINFRASRTGTAEIVAVIKHHRFILLLYGTQKQPLGLQKDHASFSSSLEMSFNWLRMGANFL